MELQHLKPLQAGSTYRSAKLLAVQEAAKDLGMQCSREYERLLAKICEETQHLEALTEKQQVELH